MTDTAMGKVFWTVTMSLDGFIAGPNDAIDWVFDYVPLDLPETRTMLEEIICTTGSVLGGRRSYNVGRRPGQRPEARKVLGGFAVGVKSVRTRLRLSPYPTRLTLRLNMRRPSLGKELCHHCERGSMVGLRNSRTGRILCVTNKRPVWR